ncbi:hypothetical protein MHBO_002763 [Bonamia ostreae]|uniref:RING-type domain-containing protein n=1 Tax=Bonamia ostreae TaxID=126728 RepID=A0ABV2ANG2_9EUKA
MDDCETCSGKLEIYCCTEDRFVCKTPPCLEIYHKQCVLSESGENPDYKYPPECAICNKKIDFDSPDFKRVFCCYNHCHISCYHRYSSNQSDMICPQCKKPIPSEDVAFLNSKNGFLPNSENKNLSDKTQIFEKLLKKIAEAISGEKKFLGEKEDFGGPNDIFGDDDDILDQKELEKIKKLANDISEKLAKNEQNEILSKKNENLQNQIKNLSLKCSNSEKEISEQKEKFSDLIRLYEKSKNEAKIASKNESKYKTENEELQNRVDRFSDELKRVTDTSTNLIDQKSKIEKKLISKIKKMETEFRETELKLKKFELERAKMAETKTQIEENLEKERKVFEEKMAAISKKSDETKMDLDKKEIDLKKMEERIKIEKEKSFDFLNIKNELEETNIENEDKIAKINEALNNEKKNRKKLEMENVVLKRKIGEVENEKKKANVKVEKMDEFCRKSEKEIKRFAELRKTADVETDRLKKENKKIILECDGFANFI